MQEKATVQHNNTLNDETLKSVTSFLSYIKWASTGAGSEIRELDVYIQGKVRDLIEKFQIIAKSTLSQEKKTNTVHKEQEEHIIISGRKYTYSNATKELNRLTDALLADSAVTYERTLLRKKIENMTKALFVHAESSKKFTDNTKESVDAIKKSVIEIVTAFQFQDFVTQRINHINSVFECINQEIEALEKQLSVQTDMMEIPDPMIKNMLDRFFLSKVSENFVSLLDAEKAKNFTVTIEEEDDEDDGIELF